MLWLCMIPDKMFKEEWTKHGPKSKGPKFPVNSIAGRREAEWRAAKAREAAEAAKAGVK